MMESSSSFLRLLLAAALCTQVVNGEQIQKSNISLINYNLYHHRDVLLQEVEALAVRHPKIITVQTLRSEVNGYASKTIVATVEHHANSSMERDKYRILLSFGQHGRELITCEAALSLLKILSGESHLLVLRNETIKKSFEKLIIKVVPMENYNGRAMVEAGRLCERKNGRGVDINRNWSVDWGKKEPDFDPTEEFPGDAPFSEPETRTMKELARSFNPHLWINVHSGMQAMFMPFDYKHALPDPTISKHMIKLLQMLNRMHCNNSCVIGPGGGSVGYLAHGTATDYMHEVLEVPFAFTFEIYGDSAAPIEDCFRMFNPTTLPLFESTINNWCMAFITIFIEFEAIFKSIPTRRSSWRDKKDSLLHVKSNEVVIQTRKYLGRTNILHSFEMLDEQEKERVSEMRLILGIVALITFSCTAFIWGIYLKSRKRSLPRYEITLPLNAHEPTISC